MSPLRTLAAAAAYLVCVFGAGFILGMIRVPLLVPRLGVRVAELIELPIVVVAIVIAAKFIVRRFDLPESFAPRSMVGCIALLFVVVAEVTVAVMLGHRSVGTYIASRDPVSGSAYILVLCLFASMPALVRTNREASANSR